MTTDPYPCPSTHCDFQTYSDDEFEGHITDECDLIKGAKDGRVVMFDEE